MRIAPITAAAALRQTAIPFPMLVVELPKVVEVKQQQRNVRTLSLGAVPLALQLPVKRAMGEQPGARVCELQYGEPLFQSRALRDVTDHDYDFRGFAGRWRNQSRGV